VTRRKGVAAAPRFEGPKAPKGPPLRKHRDSLYDSLQHLLAIFQSRDRERPCYFDVSIAECHALETLLRRGPRTINELAAALRVDKSSASRTARALEAKGYARRRTHPKDRRALQVEATPRGRSLEHRIRKGLVGRYDEAVSFLDARVRRALPAALRALAAAAARPGGEESPERPGG